jgi:hypothetical protein
VVLSVGCFWSWFWFKVLLGGQVSWWVNRCCVASTAVYLGLLKDVAAGPASSLFALRLQQHGDAGVIGIACDPARFWCSSHGNGCADQLQSLRPLSLFVYFHALGSRMFVTLLMSSYLHLVWPSAWVGEERTSGKYDSRTRGRSLSDPVTEQDCPRPTFWVN